MRQKTLNTRQLLHGYGLSGRDAAFATELAYGTLRMRGTRYSATCPHSHPAH